MKPRLKGRHLRGRSSRIYGGIFSEYIAGLRRTPKKLPCKLFYDDEGSRLFDRICGLESYYQARAEFTILRQALAEIAQRSGEGTALVELGSGTGAKGRLVLNHLIKPAAYIPIEIAPKQLHRSCQEIQADFPDLPILSVCTDYTDKLYFPPLPPHARGILMFFPGSTLGNFEPIEALAFLLKLAHLGGKGGALLIGIDLKKESELLEAAYDDPGGVTAAFNLNILARANREFAADFNLAEFRHRAFYEPLHGRIVMQLESQRDQEVRVGAEHVRFISGERITTEYSYKYQVGEFQALARLAGFSPQAVWTDPENMFSLHYLAA